MPDTETISDLVQRANAGDQAAFAELVRRFQAMAYGYAYSILGDFPLAEDAAQCAFVEAYHKLGDLCEPAAFAGWFRRIVFKKSVCGNL
jgi:RNA polymerase sigma-70 factor (ECF subfamily)